MTTHTAQTAAAAIVSAFRADAAAADAYVTAYVETYVAKGEGVAESAIAKAIKDSGSPIKAGADLVGDFALTAPLVLMDNGVSATHWVRDTYGEGTIKRLHTLVTAARVAKGQGKATVRALLAPVMELVAAPEDEFDLDAYAVAVARALKGLSKVKPVEAAPSDEAKSEDPTDADDMGEIDGQDAPATFRERLNAMAPLIASLMQDYATASPEDQAAYGALITNATMPLRKAAAAAA